MNTSTAKYITWDKSVEIFNNGNYTIFLEGKSINRGTSDEQMLISWEEDDQLFEYCFERNDNQNIATMGNKVVLLPNDGGSKFVFEVFELKPAKF